MEHIYDIAFSFAGEDRGFVEELAAAVKAKGISVFYDSFEEVDLWGKNLYQHLFHIYNEAALFCVITISSSYICKAWTKHELQAAQNRAFYENREYILPLKLEPDVKVPGLPDTIGFLNVRERTIEEIAGIIAKKVYSVKPKREEEFQYKQKFYNLLFEAFDFITSSYSALGIKNNAAEAMTLSWLVNEYRDFVLRHAKEIHEDLLPFLADVTTTVKERLDENKLSDLKTSLDLRIDSDVGMQLKNEYEQSGFNKQFDVWNFVYTAMQDRESMLKNALDNLCKRYEHQIDVPLGVFDYFKIIIKLSLFDRYVEEKLSDADIEEIAKESEEFQALSDMFDEGMPPEFDDSKNK